METLKDIAAVLGVVISAASVITIISKSFRQAIVRVFTKYGKSNEMSVDICQIKSLLEKHIEEDKKFKSDVIANNEITMEFARTQCRNIIKNIFYKYNETKILPLYEKKTLMNIEDLYINRLHSNSFASLLLTEMNAWEIDYSSGSTDEK